jgi:predicted enzyme related to lactoylglutathione lyase
MWTTGRPDPIKRSRIQSSREEGTMSEAKGSVPSHVPTKGLYGWVTHTELASSDPGATKEWCAKVLGWTFTASFPTPAGEYHLFAYSDQGGGGIRSTNAGEQPGSVPFIHVEDAHAAFSQAIEAGAEEIQAPARMSEGVTTALVRAPGGVPIGFSGP